MGRSLKVHGDIQANVPLVPQAGYFTLSLMTGNALAITSHLDQASASTSISARGLHFGGLSLGSGHGTAILSSPIMRHGMSTKKRLQNQLQHYRGFSEGLLSSFEKPEEWTHQVHPSANHALWFAGHMGVVDDSMIGLLAPEKVEKRELFQEKFGMGSQPSDRPEDYPPVGEVLDYMRERRSTLLEVLESLEDEDFAKPMPEGTPAFLPDVGSVFELVAWHEGLHSGQVSVASRALGNAPVSERKKSAAKA